MVVPRLRGTGQEWALALLLALGTGAALAVQPVLVVVAAGACLAASAISAAGVSLTAGAIGGVVLGHLVSGQLYVIGVLPEAFAVLLDLVTAGLFVTVALRPHPRAPRSHVATVAFLALGALTALNPLVPSPDYAVYGLRQFALPLLALLIVKEAELSRRDERFILAMLALGWIVNLSLALRQWLVDFTPAETSWIEGQAATYLVGDQIRLMGATQSNQDFAFLATVAIPCVTAYFMAAKRGVQRTALGLLLLLSFAVLFGSLIRSTLVGGVLGALLAATLLTAASEERGRVLGYGAAVVIVFLLLALAAPGTVLPENKAQTLSTRVTSIFDPASDPSFRQRGTEVWPRMVEIIGTHPLGGGPGSAGPLSQARAGEAPFGATVPDNGYLLMGIQFGLLGILVFVLLLGTWLRDLLARARQGFPAAAAGAGAVTALAIAMVAGSYWSLVNPSVVFGVIVGLGLRGDGRRGSDAEIGPAAEPPAAPGVDVLPPVRPAAPRAPTPPRPERPRRRVLVVAAPMVSRGGLYSYLQRVLPAVRERGWEVGLLWECRVSAPPLEADWSRRVVESGSTRKRQRRLRGAVRAAVEAWHPDLVVSMLPQSDAACSAVRRSLDVPWVAMLHGSPYPHAAEMALARRATWRAAVAVAYRRADGIVAVSGALAREARIGLGLRREIASVGSGIEIPPDARPRAVAEPVIGFLGRLAPEKAPDVFVEIAGALGCRAKVFGDGPLAPAIAAAAAANPQLQYAGWTDRDQALSELDLLVVPSRREALGLVVLEAGARRVCVIARDTGGVREVLARDPELARRCLLPAHATPEDFAAAIRPLLQDADRRVALAERLHAVVASHFSLDRHVDGLLEALASVRISTGGAR